MERYKILCKNMTSLLIAISFMLIIPISGCVSAEPKTTPPAPLLSSPSSISEETSPPPDSPEAAVPECAVVVSFNPNPVPGVDGYWHYKVTLTETRGVGVTLKSAVIRYYSSSGPAGKPHVYDTKEWFENWLPGAYLLPNGKATTGAGLPVQQLTYGIFTFTGVDDNGHEMVAEGRVDFTQTSQSAQTSPVVNSMVLHQRAWEDAANNCGVDSLYKYSVYSSRSLAVSNPEVYLQADKLWMDMIAGCNGWRANYLARNRGVTGDKWLEEVLLIIDDGFRGDKNVDAFKWEAFNWEEHRKNATDLFDFYEDAETLECVDNRLVFLWNAMKGLDWQMPYTALAEAEYMRLTSEGKDAYLILTEGRKGYVAELTENTIVLHDSLTGNLADDVDGSAVLVMNNENVWYPLMDRDDRGKDAGLLSVVKKYCNEYETPELTEFEARILEDLREGTRLENKDEFSWAKLLAIRAVNQNTWRATPLRELSAELFPERYAEDSNYSDSPNEQQVQGMVITEMGNRLSPVSAAWAEIIQRNASEPEKAFETLGNTYWERFHRTDSSSNFVYGDYYHCWLPNLDDKLISGLGNCIVEATNIMSALSLADLDEWEVYETNWFSLERRGGHVICGAYTPDGDYSLSNGLFNTRDQSILHGPLWDIEGAVAYNMIYNPKKGFIVFTQTENAANFSKYIIPFTNLSFEETVDFLEHIKTLEEDALIVENYWPAKAKTIDEYFVYITDKDELWEETDLAGLEIIDGEE